MKNIKLTAYEVTLLIAAITTQIEIAKTGNTKPGKQDVETLKKVRNKLEGK